MTGSPGNARRLGSHRVLLVDSITQIDATASGAIVVSGSHGGISAARYAAEVQALLYVFSDAGIGKDRAGIAGLDLLEEAGLAACAVSHVSARIGDAVDVLENGAVSAVNALAARLGISVGRSVREQIVALPTPSV